MTGWGTMVLERLVEPVCQSMHAQTGGRTGAPEASGRAPEPIAQLVAGAVRAPPWPAVGRRPVARHGLRAMRAQRPSADVVRDHAAILMAALG
jgi:hypothetical protein